MERDEVSYTGSPRDFNWLDGTNVDNTYNNFADGEPNNEQGSEICGIVTNFISFHSQIKSRNCKIYLLKQNFSTHKTTFSVLHFWTLCESLMPIAPSNFTGLRSFCCTCLPRLSNLSITSPALYQLSYDPDASVTIV